MSTLALFLAFFWRDLRTELSYRFAFLLSFIGIFFSVLSFFFLARLMESAEIAGLQQYDNDYFPFALIGIALSVYQTTGLVSFSNGLREAQTTGTLEALLMTPTPLSYLIIGSALWNYAFATLRVFLYLALGTLFGLRLNHAHWGMGLLILTLSIIAFASIGIFSASFIMVYKRGNPITGLFGSASNVLGGVLYPISVLPTWLQWLSHAMPITYASRAMRDALLLGANWQQLRPDIMMLGLFCLILFPSSLVAFRWAVNRARREGSLAQF